MQHILRLLFGRITWPRICSIVGIALIGGGISWYAAGQSYDFAAALLVLVTVDLVAGMISNATVATNQQWQQQPAWHRWGFVIIHVSIYPLGVWALAAPPAVRLVLLSVLIIKVALFIRGSWRRTPSL